MRAAAASLVFLLALLPLAVSAQEPDPKPAPEPVAPSVEPSPQAASGAELPERIEIGLSTEIIAITSDFSGVELTIFGAVDNIDPLIQRQGRYDVAVILEGPTSNLVTRRKERVLGIWMNVDSQAFINVPESFLIASTRPPQDMTDLGTMARLSLGVEQIRLRSYEPDTADEADVLDFTQALRRLKEEGNLYEEFPAGVRFISQSLFRAQLRLPANVPLGRHTARAYLFRQGVLVAQTQSSLDIRKAGVEFQIYEAAQNRSLLYGMASVALAFLVGWLGRVMFRKD
ncbi:TIGR02186 family protein [Oricola indica]|uniref:TIGR02186 family protein n=1 Tax=Oricola indica TaxID=2872591 RepID=UPI001CBF4660